MAIPELLGAADGVTADGVKSALNSSLAQGRRGQACDLLFACFPFLPKPDMVDPERPRARRVQAGADRELGRSAFNHPTGVGDILAARGVFGLLLHAAQPNVIVFSKEPMYDKLHIDRCFRVLWLFVP